MRPLPSEKWPGVSLHHFARSVQVPLPAAFSLLNVKCEVSVAWGDSREALLGGRGKDRRVLLNHVIEAISLWHWASVCWEQMLLALGT